MAYYSLGKDMDLKKSSTNDSYLGGKKKQSEILPMVDGLYFAIPLLFGVVAGLGFDRLFKTHPWGILTFIVAGTLGSLYNVIVLIRLTRHQTNDHNNEPTEDDDNGASA